ncbi:uncharacterized protein LOC120105382 [Phoenix dactylifera]|uniref:Uncharacterized protein LOC120105382 n=1 Tax=Phoenix dactylifera TaxID=42345 RepID=A0A8B8ZHN8_PHODC|nr:uncharacterized protein LOC120105382 [Phoenix dactylifera]
MKILLWNCRGAGKPSFIPAFRRLVHHHSPDICVLLETRLSGRGLQKARRAVPGGWGFFAVDSQGLSGGIIVTWAQGCCQLDIFNVCNQEVIMVISEGNRNPWVLAAVYASTDYRVRRVLWEEATQLISQGHPMLLAGDFNCIVDPQEKMGGKPFSFERKIREFQDFLMMNGLVDLGFAGPKFTWCNNQQGQARVWERLDRACATAGWIQSFPDYQVRHLPRIASDHCPLLVSTDALAPARSPFRFEKIWLGYPRSWEMVREAWRVPVRGDAMYRVSRRLEMTRRRLRRWNREEVGNIFRRVEDLEGVITRLQLQESQGGGLSEEEVGKLRSHLALHDSLLRQHEIFWRQKSRIQWLLEGDRNTSFFHQATVIRRHQNRIKAIRGEDGLMTEDPVQIRRIVESFFRTRWTEQLGDGSSEDIPVPGVGVSEEETAALIRPVSEREVREAVWSLEGDKAPGPDVLLYVCDAFRVAADLYHIDTETAGRY